MSKQLTAKQLEALKPYASHMANATQGVFRYPGDTGIDTLRKVWSELTGTTYPYQAGCTRCITELLKDMGTLYFAVSDDKPEDYIQKKVYYYNEKTDRLEVKKPEAPKTAKKAASVASDAPKAAEATTTPKKSSTAAKSPKNAKK